MNLVEFSEFLVTKVTKNPELVSVKELKKDDVLYIEILVAEEDMGRVIGRQGKIASSIKTLVQAKAYNDGIKNVRVNIDSLK